MITILYPIYELYNDEYRVKAFNLSLKNLDPRFNIVISDSGRKSSKSYIDTNKPYNYTWESNNSDIFNKSITINNGFKYIKDELFIILDSEIIMHPEIYDKLLFTKFIGNIYFFAITKHIHFNEPNTANEYFDLGKESKNKDVTIHNYKPGRFIFTNKKTFNSLNGFDESYVGYGQHDWDFMIRFIKTHPYLLVQCLDVFDIHLYHLNERLNKEYELYQRNREKRDNVFISMGLGSGDIATFTFKQKYYKEYSI